MSSTRPFATANTWEKYFLTSATAAESDKLIESITTVSYTHLTLPTNREV